MTRVSIVTVMTNMTLMTLMTLMTCIGCDPVHETKVDSLGGETAGVPKGPTHRPGQPCLVCHGSEGPASPQFAVAGTIYQKLETKIPSVGTRVHLTDAFGRTRDTVTNEVGTFYLQTSDWEPVYPLNVAVCPPGSADCDVRIPGSYLPMKTRIGREGSCAGCHFDPEGQDSPGHVYIPEVVADAGPG